MTPLLTSLALAATPGGAPPPAAASGPPVWPPHVVVPALVVPCAVAAADLGRDGVVDLVAADDYFGLFRAAGLGGGTFGQFRRFGMGAARDVALADLDGDGWLDLTATSPVAEASVVTFTATSDGGFGHAVAFPGLEGGAEGVDVGDLDGDGDRDLVVAMTTGEVVTIRHRWDGLWDPATTIAQGAEPVEVEGADLDGDLDLDVTVSWRGRDRVSWIEGLGDGTFGPEHTLGGRVDGVEALVTADLDGDGDVDVLAGARGSGRVVLWENLGGGAFDSEPTLVDHGTEPAGLAVGDLDGDGDPDLVVADLGEAVRWRENLGGCAFGPASGIALTLRSTNAAIADVDGDGDRDVTAVPGGYNGVVWYENAVFADADHDGLSDAHEASIGTDPARADSDGGGRSDGEELEWGTSPVDPTDDGSIDRDGDLASDAEEKAAGTDPLAFDTDRDGVVDGSELAGGTDPLATDTDRDGSSDGQEHACGSDPLDAADTDTDCDGLSDAEELALGTDPAIADTDRDGLDDGDELEGGTDPLVADTDGGGTSDGEEVASGRDPFWPLDDWRRRVITSDKNASSLAALDFDGDGDLDVVVVALSRVMWFENLGNSAFGSVHDLSPGGPGATALLAVDLDLDGLQDLVMLAVDGRLRWFRAGEPSALQEALGVASAPTLVAADPDGDGDPDLLVGRDSNLQWLQYKDLTVFEPMASTRISQTLSTLAVADLVGDETPDVVALLVGGPPTVVLLQGVEALRLAPPFRLAHGEALRSVAVVDLDVDGLPDVVLARAGDRPDLAWLRARGGGFPDHAAPVAEVNGTPAVLVVGNLDHDGDEDLVLTSSTGTTTFVSSAGSLVAGRIGLDDARAAILADLDADGAPDVVAVTVAGVVWYRNALPDGTDPPPPDRPEDTGAEETAPDPPRAPRGGCGCDQTPADPFLLLVLALAAVAHSRKRRRS